MQLQSRRSFFKTSSVTAAGLVLAPNILRAATKPANALNVAIIGAGGKGGSDLSEIAPGNHIAAICDVDLQRAAGSIAKFPGARVYTDYREMFADMADQIDVVTVSTPDHMHFPIAMEAIRRGKPVFVQKPLANTIWEARTLGQMAAKHNVLTVMGNQGATLTGTRILREWIDGGLIGDITEVHYWTNRPIWLQGKGLVFPSAKIPDGLNWNVWQGSVATDRPYSPKIHPFAWRGFWDYGCGALGDIGCHSMQSAFWCLNLGGDFVVEASKVSDFDDTTAPSRCTIVYEFPEKNGRKAVKVIWQDGVGDANNDPQFVRPPGIPDDLELNPQFGQVFVGTEGVIYVPDAYCQSVPKLFTEELKAKAKEIPRMFERVKGGPTQELCRAIRGEGPKPVSNFSDQAAPLTEMVLAGNLAVRLGKRIDWNSAAMEARGLPEAQSLIKRAYRSGWEPKIA